MVYRDFQGMQLSALGMGAMRLPTVNGNDAEIDGAAAEAKRAINCRKAFRSLSNRFFTPNSLCDLQNSVMEGIIPDGAGMFRKNAFLMRPNVIVNMQEYNPPVPEKIDELLQDLIKYIAVDQSVDILMKAALVYYQFEIIHPFNSGNGRVGRLLPALLLISKGSYQKAVCLFQNIFISIMMCVWICISGYSILEIIQNG